MNIYIRNIVFGCPDPKTLAEFYAELLDRHVIRTDWHVVARDSESFPRLAFGDGPGEYHRPRWPDPEYPQQLHLDISVDDPGALEQRAFRLGAYLLQDVGDHRTYADPDGHPFCIYPALEASGTTNQLPAISRVVFDCFSPRSLASFYGELMDMRDRVEDSPDRVVILGTGTGPMLAFQHAQNAAPRWPDPNYPQQLHLDLHVDDGVAANDLALRLGAIRLPKEGGSCPVYADPTAHPFCLCSPGE
jgi:catechol 2,3-dioxygenase-like lactoylglutathione lyase family enzyme